MRLERRYRHLLILLPRWYRAAHEEEMVAGFWAREIVRADEDEGEQTGEELDDLRGEYGWPDRAEIATVAKLAIQTRFSHSADPSRGAAFRLIALLGLLAHSAVTLTPLLGLLLTYWWDPPGGRDPTVDLVEPVTRVGSQAVVALPWVLAYLALVLAGRRTAQVLVSVAVLISVVRLGVLVAMHGSVVIPTEFVTAVLVWLLPVACVFVGFHREAPRPRRQPWLIALPVAIVVIGGLGLLAYLLPQAIALPLIMRPETAPLVVAAAVLLGARLRRPARVPPSWLAALSALTVPILLVHMVILAVYGQLSPIAAASVIVVLAVAGIALAVAASRATNGRTTHASTVS